MKTRVLVVGDAGYPTGFERVVTGIAGWLHRTGNYEVIVRGTSYVEGKGKSYPWKVKPCGGVSDDPLGVLAVTKWLEEDRPDVTVLVNDLWNITNYLSYFPKDAKTVAYFPVDTPNLKNIYCLGLGAVSRAVAYTRFGAMEAAAGVRDALDLVFQSYKDNKGVLSGGLEWMELPKDGMLLQARFDRFMRYQNPSEWTIIPHGMDLSVFGPRDKSKARELFGLPKDAFVVLNVNTNQFRKRQDLTLRAFKVLLERVPNAVLVFHCHGGDRQGWDLRQMALYLEIPPDRVYCVHHVRKSLSDSELCWLYNTADVQINTAGGEGYGLTSFEGAACGVPQLVPDWSATRELWKDHGILLPVANYRAEPKYLNTLHAEIDVEAAASVLAGIAESRAEWSKYSELALDLAASQWSWDQVGAAFEEQIQMALREPDAKRVTYAELGASREPGVQSELRGKPLLRK